MIGEVLKKAREGKGLSLERVATDLKIRVTQLKAIEEEDFSIFPADVYTMGYIRAYSLYLGINPEPLIEHFKRLRSDIPKVSPEETKPELMPSPFPSDKNRNLEGPSKKELRASLSFRFNPGIFVILTVFLIAAVTIFSVFKTTKLPDIPSHSVKEEDKTQKEESNQAILLKKEQKKLPIPLPPEKATTDTQASSLQDKISPSHINSNTRENIKSPTEKDRAAQPEKGTNIPAQEQIKSLTGQMPGPSQDLKILKIIATELTWLIVQTERDSHDITLKPGEAVQFSSKEGFKLTIGNAGGIKLVLNGKDLGSPGKSGEVRVMEIGKP